MVFKKSKKKHAVYALITASVCLVLAGCLLLASNAWSSASSLPQLITSYDAKHHIKYVKFSDISPFSRQAAVASQDERFYYNLGIDVLGTFRAILLTIFTNQRQGASTIPEQLAKNVFFEGQDNLHTDIQTKILAPFVVFNFSKDSILEMYLNVIYFGRSSYGISNASSVYFQTTPDKLSLAQAAYLLGLINAPTYLSKHPKASIFQAELVLGEMQKDGKITSQQENEAENALQNIH